MSLLHAEDTMPLASLNTVSLTEYSPKNLNIRKLTLLFKVKYRINTGKI